MAQIEIIFPEGRVQGDVTRHHLAQSIQLLKRMLLDQLRQDYLSFRQQAEMLGVRLEALTAPHSDSTSGVSPVFIHPHNPSLVWSGRGRRPNWVREFFPDEPAKGKATPTSSAPPGDPVASSDTSLSAAAAQTSAEAQTAGEQTTAAAQTSAEAQTAGEQTTAVPAEELPAETSGDGFSGENGAENSGDNTPSGAVESPPAAAVPPTPSPRRSTPRPRPSSGEQG